MVVRISVKLSRFALAALTVFVLMMGLAHVAKAAEISVPDSPYCKVKLDGVISPGDTDKLTAFVKNNKIVDLERYDPGYALCLNSAGGSLNEALKLAKYFQNDVVTTVIDQNDACLSACSIAFMFGTEAAGDYIGSKRAMHFTARLGFHRPSLSIPNRADYTDEQIDKALKVVLDSVVNLLIEANKVFFGHSQPIMTSDLIEKMFDHEGEDFYEITTVDQVGRWNIDVLGWRPPERMELHHAHNACMNILSWPVGLTTNYRPLNFASGLEITGFESFQYNGDASTGYKTARAEGQAARIALNTPSPAGDDNGGGQCIFSREVSTPSAEESYGPVALINAGIQGCGSDSSTSVDFGQGECSTYTFEKNPYGNAFFFDQFLSAIAMANPKATLSELASQRAFDEPVYMTDCFVLRNRSELERNKCSATVHKKGNGEQAEYFKTFTWPSSNKTIIAHDKTGVKINGKRGIPRDRQELGSFVECVTNTSSGNEFCHGVRRN
ncbi:MAG: hypothetical protein JJ858_08205 [Rhizobiaceae bacterium]|nr:hypothetical protein [Rhizobiaceae bacterium]